MLFLTVLLIVLLPAILIWAEKYVKVIAWLSPAFFCYALGILFANVLPLDGEWSKQLMKVSVALAIPLLLFSADMKSWLRLAPSTARSYGVYLFSVLVCTALVGKIFAQTFDDTPIRAAMAGSVYTGGTANMAAIHVALKGAPTVFAEMNLTDLMLSGTYLIFLLTFATRVFRYFLPPFQKAGTSSESVGNDPEAFLQLRFPLKVRNVLISLLGGGMALGISAGLAIASFGKMEGTMVVVLITLLGLAASRIKALREMPGSYETGQYLFLMFCVAAGAQIDLRVLLDSNPIIVGFMFCIFAGSLLTHFFLSKWLKIDADTALITGVAGLFGPPFIGPVAQVLDNREIVVSGLTLGVIGLAVGNFMGFLVHYLLSF